MICLLLFHLEKSWRRLIDCVPLNLQVSCVLSSCQLINGIFFSSTCNQNCAGPKANADSFTSWRCKIVLTWNNHMSGFFSWNKGISILRTSGSVLQVGWGWFSWVSINFFGSYLINIGRQCGLVEEQDRSSNLLVNRARAFLMLLMCPFRSVNGCFFPLLVIISYRSPITLLIPSFYLTEGTTDLIPN